MCVSHSQVVADTAEAGQSATPQDAATLTLTPEILAGMSPELRSTAPATEAPAGDEPELPEDEEDTPVDDDSGEESEDDASDEDEETPPEDEVATWVSQFDENPNTASRIPRKLLGPVLQSWRSNVEDAATRAVLQNTQVVAQRTRQLVEMEYRVKEIDQLESVGDFDQRQEKIAEFPGGAKNYYRVKADMQPNPASSPVSFNQRAAQLVSQLANNKAASDEIAANFARNKYVESEESMMQLAIDVGALLQKHSGSNSDPATQELQRKRDAQARRRAAPRPDVSDGVGNNGKLKMADLKLMSAEQVAELLSDPVKAKEVNEALAGAR